MPLVKAFLAIVIAIVIFPFSVTAQSDPDTLLQRVSDDIVARSVAADGVRFSYNMDTSVAGSKEYTVSLAYQPLADRATQWQVISPSFAENEEVYAQAKKQIDKDVEHKPDAKDDQALILREVPGNNAKELIFISEEDGIAKYAIQLTEGFMNPDGGDDKGMSKMLKYLKGEIAIDVASEQLLWFRIFAEKPFKPMAVAKIKKFDIKLHFAPAWHEGPIVQVRSESIVSGSALFQKFNEKSEITFSNFVQK
ncbi:hypothetical protein JYT75_00640 [Oceanicaulis sp. AH-315-P02]|nr:hypothetical protein [Robiginitomaculum sp.]MBN4047805.1 hypothetical protein [Oceanicaulis sp. AH-315-P02]